MSSNQIQPGSAATYVDPSGYNRQLIGQFMPTLFASATLNTASGTTPVTVLTAPSNMYIFIIGIQITTDPTCTTSGGGIVQSTLSASTSGTIAVLRQYIPAAFTAPTTPTCNRQTSAPGNFWASQQTGETLTVVNNNALTAGSIRVAFHYGYSNVPIGNS